MSYTYTAACGCVIRNDGMIVEPCWERGRGDLHRVRDRLIRLLLLRKLRVAYTAGLRE